MCGRVSGRKIEFVSHICAELHNYVNQLQRYYYPYDESCLPDNGLYILFEKGETGHDVDRIVRIGINKGESNLKSRIGEHFINKNKDRSIFRKNIGRALISKRGGSLLEHWDIDLTSHATREVYKDIIDHEKLMMIEQEVSGIIQSNFSFVVIQENSGEKRKDFEAKLIATVSNCSECYPSADWLGKYSPKEKIRRSGLWQENHLWKQTLSWDEFEGLKRMNN